MKTALYRHFDAFGRLLYVGISLGVLHRLAGHKQSHWSNEIADVKVEYFATRDAAIAAEATAIKAERPAYNKQHTARKADHPNKIETVKVPSEVAVYAAEQAQRHYLRPADIVRSIMMRGLLAHQLDETKRRNG
jgi:excinuclease UvrABC nuclease subunit